MVAGPSTVGAYFELIGATLAHTAVFAVGVGAVYLSWWALSWLRRWVIRRAPVPPPVPLADEPVDVPGPLSPAERERSRTLIESATTDEMRTAAARMGRHRAQRRHGR